MSRGELGMRRATGQQRKLRHINDSMGVQQCVPGEKLVLNHLLGRAKGNIN